MINSGWDVHTDMDIVENKFMSELDRRYELYLKKINEISNKISNHIIDNNQDINYLKNELLFINWYLNQKWYKKIYWKYYKKYNLENIKKLKYGN